MPEGDLELMTRVASLYYMEDVTQADIASRLGLSRPKVGRLLEKARREGVVDIAIRTHPALSAGLEAELVARFELGAVVLVADQFSEDAQRALTARAAADLLARSLRDGDVVAVGMGRNVGTVPDQLVRPAGRACTFVAAMGGSPQVGGGINPNDICRRLAEGFRGRAESLYAPAYADSVASREAFVHHSDVRETLARARMAQTALVGIGDARNDSAVVQMGCFSAAEMSRMREAGAVGDILGFFFDVEGRAAGGGIGERVVGLSADDLRGVPRVIAVSSEEDKARSVLGALRTGIVDVLVTSIGTGRQVLAAAAAPVGA
jgi:DNA-binding transcriptional regulator LsrR (DeoR family)